MNKATQHYRKWWLLGASGLLLVGAGLSLHGEAAGQKLQGAPLRRWFITGTLALAVTNAGLSVFGTAVIERLRYLQARDGQ